MYRHCVLFALLAVFALVAAASCAEDPKNGGPAGNTVDPAQAQKRSLAKHGKMDPAAHATMMQENLGLSDEQTKQAAAAFEAATWPERKEKLKEILTPEEQKQFEAVKAKRGGHGSCGCDDD